MDNVRQCVAFSILMENGNGILDKAPDYIREKYRLCAIARSDQDLLGLLDPINQAKFLKWVLRWE